MIWVSGFGEKYSEEELRKHTKKFLTEYYKTNKVPVKKGLYILLEHLKGKSYKYLKFI